MHELSHIVHGPHDAKFHKLWNQLRDEHEGLLMKGYTGEGFLSKGHRLGGKEVPKDEARRLARKTAERRRTHNAGSGRRLGGIAPQPGQDIRKTMADAVERRNSTLKGCGNTNHNEQEIQQISETATKNGFRTQAEEDAANEEAIAQAYWELVQEDEKRKFGNSYIPPSAENPAGNGGWSEVSEQSTTDSLSSGHLPSGSRSSVQSGHLKPNTTTNSAPAKPPVPTHQGRRAEPVSASGWACTICTLQNPAHFLCCDACGTERSEEAARKMIERATKKPNTDRTTASSSGRHGGSQFGSSAAAASSRPMPPQATWTCSFCGNIMEKQWWTCSICEKMKDNSR